MRVRSTTVHSLTRVTTPMTKLMRAGGAASAGTTTSIGHRRRVSGARERFAPLVRAVAVAVAFLATIAVGARPAQAALDIYIPAGTFICVYYDDYCDIASAGFHAAAHCYGHYPYLPINGDDVWTKFSGNGYSNWFVPKAQTGPRPGLPRCPGTVGP